jgi:hypothetical protein
MPWKNQQITLPGVQPLVNFIRIAETLLKTSSTAVRIQATTVSSLGTLVQDYQNNVIDYSSLADQVITAVSGLNEKIQVIPYFQMNVRLDKWVDVVTDSIRIHKEKTLPLSSPGVSSSIETVKLDSTRYTGAAILVASTETSDIESRVALLREFLGGQIIPPGADGLYAYSSTPSHMSYALNNARKPQDISINTLFKPISKIQNLVDIATSTLPRNPKDHIQVISDMMLRRADELDGLASKLENIADSLDALSQLFMYVCFFDVDSIDKLIIELTSASDAPIDQYVAGILLLDQPKAINTLGTIL